MRGSQSEAQISNHVRRQERRELAQNAELRDTEVRLVLSNPRGSTGPNPQAQAKIATVIESSQSFLAVSAKSVLLHG